MSVVENEKVSSIKFNELALYTDEGSEMIEVKTNIIGVAIIKGGIE
jgi:hypothetical protein